MDRKFVFLLVVAVISISAKVNQKKKCREMCESNKYCKSWKYNEKTNKCKITIKKGVRRPRKSVPCETATKCKEMFESNIQYCESWKFNEKSKLCTMTLNQDFVVGRACTRDVVKDRCTARGIPSEVQRACLSIGEGLIQKYKCTHESQNFFDSNQETCCRDVVLNLCNGSPDEVQVNGTTIQVRQPCIGSGYTDCILKDCSINCLQKVLTEMCGITLTLFPDFFNCFVQANKIATRLTSEVIQFFGYCNGIESVRATCTKAVNELCEAVDITEPNIFCKRLGQNLCDTN